MHEAIARALEHVRRLDEQAEQQRREQSHRAHAHALPDMMSVPPLEWDRANPKNRPLLSFEQRLWLAEQLRDTADVVDRGAAERLLLHAPCSAAQDDGPESGCLRAKSGRSS
jgi:hypothetical protein